MFWKQLILGPLPALPLPHPLPLPLPFSLPKPSEREKLVWDVRCNLVQKGERFDWKDGKRVSVHNGFKLYEVSF